MLVPEALGRVHCIAVEHLICRPATPTGAKYMLFILAPFLHGFGGSHQSLIYGSLFLIKIQSPAACTEYTVFVCITQLARLKLFDAPKRAPNLRVQVVMR